MNQPQLFEAALGIKAPWYVQGVDFDAARRELTIAVDFVAGRGSTPEPQKIPSFHIVNVNRFVA